MPQPNPPLPADGLVRCPWCGTDPLYMAYHDTEWGVPLHNDHALFELLVLEGAQAGLSWLTILRRREGYRAAYAEVAGAFDAEHLARLTEADQLLLLGDERIIRNRQKVAASVGNARAFLDIQAQHGSFAAYLWRFVEGRAIQNAWQELRDAPATTPLSDAISKDLKARGMKFVGGTIMYAFMQSAGLVNDHLVRCHRHSQVAGL